MNQWNNYELIRDKCIRCNNCNSAQQLEVHHRVFRSEWDYWVAQNIKKFKKIYEDSRGFGIGTWGLHDIQNLVVLCAHCHKNRIHWGDYRLRDFYKHSFTEPKTMFNILFQKPNKTLF